jgi:hypothetical protein
MRALIALWLVAICAGCASVKPTGGPGRPFDFQRDTFAYANETVFHYENGVHVADAKPQDCEDAYTRRCFLMAAGAIQFWKHARFDPQAPPVSADELARRVRQVRERAAWWTSEPVENRVVLPGFASLHELSEREGRLLRANMGAGWTTYFHLRKFPMPFTPSHTHQARLCEELRSWLRQGHPMAVWLYNFPDVDINHAVTVFEETTPPQPGRIVFRVYDPNYTDAPRTLVYDTPTQTFSYVKTFYFVGGPVHVRQMYTSLLR